MTSTPEPVDERLLATEDLARAALAEITAPANVGPAAGYLPEGEGVISLRFENRLPGYPGWYWTVSVGVVEDAEPTVLEVELLPGDGALLAPDWVPWAVRLAEYQATQAALAEAAESDDEESDDLDDDADDLEDDEDEDDELDANGSPILHAGDLDGVDIDELDTDHDDDSDEDEADGDGADEESDDDDSDADDSVTEEPALELEEPKAPPRRRSLWRRAPKKR